MNARPILVWSLKTVGFIALAAVVLGGLLWLPHKILPQASQRTFGAGWLLVLMTINASDELQLLAYARRGNISRGWRVFNLALIAAFMVAFAVDCYRDGWAVAAAGELAGIGLGVVTTAISAMVATFGRRVLAPRASAGAPSMQAT